MQVTGQIQEALITILMYYENEAPIVAGLVEPGLFDSIFKILAEKAITYRERHNEVPGEHTVDLFSEAAEVDEGREELYSNLFKSVKANRGTLNPDFVIGKARDFVGLQVFNRSLALAFRQSEKGTPESLEKAKAIMATALERRVDVFDPGLQFGVDAQRTMAWMDAQHSAFPMGIKEFDQRDLGPARGELWCLAAPTGKGKSWFANHLAKMAIIHAHSPLIISLEMGEKAYAHRNLMTWFGLAKRAIPQADWLDFTDTDDPEDRGSMTRRVRIPEPEHMQDTEVLKRMVQRLEDFKDRPPFWLKSFAPRSLSIDGLELYLDMMERSEGYVPSLMIIDYLDLMKLPGRAEKHQELEEISIQFRRIAHDRDIGVATFSQVNVPGGAKRVRSWDTKGAKAKVETADKWFTMSQTEMEQKKGLCRIRCEKGRGDEDGIEVLVSQNYKLGQSVMSSTLIGKNYMDELT